MNSRKRGQAKVGGEGGREVGMHETNNNKEREKTDYKEKN